MPTQRVIALNHALTLLPTLLSKNDIVKSTLVILQSVTTIIFYESYYIRYFNFISLVFILFQGLVALRVAFITASCLWIHLVILVFYNFKFSWMYVEEDASFKSSKVVVLKFFFLAVIMIPVITVFSSYKLRKHTDRQIDDYFVGIYLQTLKKLQKQRQLLAYEKVMLHLFPDFVANFHSNLDFQAKETNSQFRKIHLSKFTNVSIIFADIAGFTKLASQIDARQIVAILHQLFGQFDVLGQTHHCERIKLLGDCYYCVSGIQTHRDSKHDIKNRHAQNCVSMAKDMIDGLGLVKDLFGVDYLNMRIGIHTGTVHCGVLGVHRWQFDIWSNDVDIASAMESSGHPGEIQISEKTKDWLDDRWELVEREQEGEDGRRVNLVERFPQLNIEDLKTFWVGKLTKKGSKLQEVFNDVRVKQDRRQSMFMTKAKKILRESTMEYEPDTVKTEKYRVDSLNFANLLQIAAMSHFAME